MRRTPLTRVGGGSAAPEKIGHTDRSSVEQGTPKKAA